MTARKKDKSIETPKAKKSYVRKDTSLTEKVPSLTPLEREFIDEYSSTWNLKLTCKKMGIDRVIANDILSGKNVSRTIRRMRFVETQSALAYESVGKKEVISEYAKVAFVDIADCFDSEGMVKNIHDIPEEVRRSISSYKHTEDGIEVKFWNKTNALDSLAKILGMFVTKIENKSEVRYVVDAPMPSQDAELWEERLHKELISADRAEQELITQTTKEKE